MRLIADYHTHTVYSHGKGTILDNVMAARSKGLKKIVIADHGPHHIGFGVKVKGFLKMRKEIDELNDRIKDIEVLMGIESNIIGRDGTIDVPKEHIHLFDILLAGYHYGVRPMGMQDIYQLTIKNGLGKISKSWYDKAKTANTDTLIRAIERYPIHIITHPGAKIPIDTHRLSQAAGHAGTWLEINASHGYMTREYVQIAKEYHVTFVINSDAHTPIDVGNFAKGIRIAEEAGLKPRDIVNAEEGD